jgi:hypothetical protein
LTYRYYGYPNLLSASMSPNIWAFISMIFNEKDSDEKTQGEISE